jgi:hypothetical protein
LIDDGQALYLPISLNKQSFGRIRNMAAITAGLVAQLRERTGLGMMECKKALTETDGDLEAAIELLRKKGTKDRGERVAGEGLIVRWRVKSQPLLLAMTLRPLNKYLLLTSVA